MYILNENVCMLLNIIFTRCEQFAGLLYYLHVMYCRFVVPGGQPHSPVGPAPPVVGHDGHRHLLEAPS